MEKYKEVERSIIKRFRKDIWAKFVCAVQEYKLIEENDSIIFMHKVLPGATDQSYGINVAKLAKIPDEVIYRAKDILEKLNEHNQIDADVLSINNYQKPIIIDKRDTVETEIIERIKKVKTDDLKPIDALLLISELKEKLGE